MNNLFKRNIVFGFLWSFIGRFGYIVIGFIVNIILARVLSPFEFGQVGIIMFFVVIARVLTESGLSGALIRKNNITEKDYSTVFIFNLSVSISLMLILMIFSGTIADFYNDPKLQNILIATSSILLINSFQITQNAKLIKELKFKKKALYEFISIFISGTIAIILAFNKAGVWAIVTMQISTAFLLSAILWIFEGPLRYFYFSKKSFQSLYKFGVNTTLASILETGFDNIYQLILGKYFAISQTGLFFQAKKLQEVPIGIIKSTTLGVVFSSLAQVQNDSRQFNILYKRIITLFTVIVGLICFLVFFYAENIILILYGEKWIGAVFYIQVLICASFFYMQEMFNRVIFKVFDKTEKILYLEIIKKSIQSITIIIGLITKSIDVLLYGFLITSILSFLINYQQSRKIQNNFSWDEIILVLKTAIISVITVIIGITVKYIFEIENFYSFILLPLLVIFYLITIKLLSVFDIVKDSKLIIKLLKNKNV